MCRAPILCTFSFVLNGIPLNLDDTHVNCHSSCGYNLKCLYAKTYFEKLEGDWRLLVRFMIRTQFDKKLYPSVKGTDHLNLTEYEEEGRLLSTSKSHATLKTEDDKIQVVFCCKIASLSMRLVIMANEDDIPVEADDEYADAAVKILMTQIDNCWKVLSLFMDTDIPNHVFIRKFGGYTVSLLLSGTDEREALDGHKQPMKDQIRQLKRCNFAAECLREQRNKFPRIKYLASIVDHDYFRDLFCCYPETLKHLDADDNF